MAFLSSFVLNSKVSVVTLTSEWQTLLGMIHEITRVARAALVIRGSLALIIDQVAVFTLSSKRLAAFVHPLITWVAATALVIRSSCVDRQYGVAICTFTFVFLECFVIELETTVAAAALVICSSFANRKRVAMCALTFEFLAFFVLELIARVAAAALVILSYLVLGEWGAVSTTASIQHCTLVAV